MPSCSCAPEAGVVAGLCPPCPVLSQSHRVAPAGCGQEHKTPGGERGLQEAAEAGLKGPGTGLPAWAVRKRPRPKDVKRTGRGGALTPFYVSDNTEGLCDTWGAASQAEVSKRRSIMSPTCSTRYLMYFSGFLVKGTLPYLRGTGVRGRPRPAPVPPPSQALLTGCPSDTLPGTCPPAPSPLRVCLRKSPEARLGWGWGPEAHLCRKAW